MHALLQFWTDAELLDQAGLECAANVIVGSNVCVETHNAEQTVPWVVGQVFAGARVAEIALPEFDEGQDAIRFEAVRAGDCALRVRLWEALEPGSSTFTLSDVEVLVAAQHVRVPDVELVAARQVLGDLSSHPTLSSRFVRRCRHRTTSGSWRSCCSTTHTTARRRAVAHQVEGL